MNTTKEQIAARLDGMQYKDKILLDINQEAADNKLVIVFGVTDKLVRFIGSLWAETSCGTTGNIYLQKIRKRGAPPTITVYNENDLGIYTVTDPLKFANIDRKKMPQIKAVWTSVNELGEAVCAWHFTTNIPHATFKVFEGSSLFCEGIVFSRDDI